MVWLHGKGKSNSTRMIWNDQWCKTIHRVVQLGIMIVEYYLKVGSYRNKIIGTLSDLPKVVWMKPIL